MIGQATAHRRANAFAQAIEDADLEGAHGESADGSPGGPAGGPPGGPGASGERDPGATGGSGGHGAHAADRRAAPEQVSMVAVAAALSKRPRPTMDPERKTVQRAQLIAAMEQAIADGSFRGAAPRVPEQRSEAPASGLRKLSPRSRLSRRLAVGGLTMGVAAGALGGVAAASTNALPGDTLYGLKRGMEDLKLDMAGNDASRGKVYLDLASTRMQEARRLMDRGRGGQLDTESVAEVRRALSGMHQEASEGHRLLTEAYEKDGSLEPMELLNTFADSHRQSWADLRGKLPSQLTDVSDQVSSIFDAIDAEVAPLALPHASGTHAPAREGDGSGSSGASGGAPTGSPSATATAGQQDGPAAGRSASPSPSGSTAGSLLTSGGLLGPAPTDPSGAGTPTATPTTPDHSVVLPPLLPGLLPGLGLSGNSDDE